MFSKYKVNKEIEDVTEYITESNREVLSEIIIHFTPNANFLYKNYYSRDFYTAIYIEDKYENQTHINGAYVIIPLDGTTEEKIIEKYKLNNLSIPLTVIDYI